MQHFSGLIGRSIALAAGLTAGLVACSSDDEVTTPVLPTAYEDVKLVAYALIRSGIQIRRIGPPSLKNADWRTGVSTTWRTNREPHIWIGSNATYDNKPALTVEQVQRASAFREEQ